MRTKTLTSPHRVLGRRIMERDIAKGVAVIKIQRTEPGFANPRGVFQYGFKDRIKFSRRTGDDLQYFRCGGLLFQRLRKIIGALPQLAEQPGVLDGDDGLGSKISD